MSIEKLFLEAMKEHGDIKVEKTVPIKKEWKPLLAKMNELHTEYKKAKGRKSRAKSAFWAMVEEDLDTYEKGMRLNEEDSEIEIYED